MPGVRVINHSFEPEVPVRRLREHPRNPRRGNLEKIDESMERNGFYGAVYAQLSTGHILKGNHTFRKAVQRGAAALPVIWLDVTDEVALSILLADNNSADAGGYDNAVLQALLTDYYAAVGTLQGTTYDQVDFARIMGEPFETFQLPNVGMGLPAPESPGEASAPGEPAGPPMVIPERWDVLIECASEEEQVALIERLAGEGMRVRALVS